MTPEHSPYPIAVTSPMSRLGLREIADWMEKKRVGYVIVKDRTEERKSFYAQFGTYQTYVLYRAEVPTDDDDDKPKHVSWRRKLKHGRTDGPKPGTKAWDRKIVETWGP